MLLCKQIVLYKVNAVDVKFKGGFFGRGIIMHVPFGTPNIFYRG